MGCTGERLVNLVVEMGADNLIEQTSLKKGEFYFCFTHAHKVNISQSREGYKRDMKCREYSLLINGVCLFFCSFSPAQHTSTHPLSHPHIISHLGEMVRSQNSAGLHNAHLQPAGWLLQHNQDRMKRKRCVIGHYLRRMTCVMTKAKIKIVRKERERMNM